MDCYLFESRLDPILCPGISNLLLAHHDADCRLYKRPRIESSCSDAPGVPCLKTLRLSLAQSGAPVLQ
ncbi:hypothetical protein RRG08_034516 [Elysia crispata]|uniref:Uncharacterized protein n=1 Tax=Elysia crispata TaxID=231223 RepID=A0AAE1BA56_9GAST|nr:hypothetical protein RRG08_034516 [Elysia crispata]